MTGISALGLLLLAGCRRLDLNVPPWLAFQAPIIGVSITSVILLPLALIGYAHRWVLVSISLLLCFLGITLLLWILFKKLPDVKALASQFQLRFAIVIVIAFLIGYFLISLSPITDADALDYHVGVAQHVVQYGSWPVRPEWFTSRLAGSGEVLIALGLSVGVEQLGSLIQWSALVSVVALFALLPNVCEKRRIWGVLAFLSIPTLLALASTPKPLLMPIAMTTLALVLLVTAMQAGTGLTERQRLLVFSITGLVAITAVSMKLSSLPAAALVLIAALISFTKSRKAFFYCGGIIFGLSLVILAPYFLWKSLNFGGTLLESFTQPFPGNWPGTEAFETYLRTYRDSALPLPLSLMVVTSFGSVTQFLGLSIAITMIMSLSRWTRIQIRIITLAILLALTITLTSQATSRFFIEPMIWVWIGLFVFGDKRISDSPRPWRWRTVKVLIILQILLVLPLLIFGVTQAFPGSLKETWRESVMTRQANGWALMQWVDDSLPKDAIFISEHRSVGLAPRQFVPVDWRTFASQSDGGDQTYLDLTNEYNPTFALVFGEDRETVLKTIPCAESIYRGPFVTTSVARNPLNIGGPGFAWLVQLKTDCVDIQRG